MITKKQAVLEQLEGAMLAHERGDNACAITLAGAAEGAMPQSEFPTLFAYAKAAALSRPDLFPGDEKDIVAKINSERDWLKHFSINQPSEIELISAFMMIARAFSRFFGVYGPCRDEQAVQQFWKLLRVFVEGQAQFE